MAIDPLRLQKQIRENSQDVQAYLEELASWEKEVSGTDKKLTEGKIQLTKPTSKPPRNSGATSPSSKAADASRAASTVPTPPAAAKKAESSGAAETPFEQQKELGNAEFKAGRFAEAIVHYSKCVQLDERSAIALLNRAMAFIKLSKFREAEQDCSRALALEPGNSKALYRRGLSRQNLKNYAGAIEDYGHGLRADPTNKALKDALQAVHDLAKASPAPAPTQTPAQASPAPPAPVPVAVPAEPGRKKLVIQEVDDSDDDEEQNSTGDDEAAVVDHVPSRSPSKSATNAAKGTAPPIATPTNTPLIQLRAASTQPSGAVSSTGRPAKASVLTPANTPAASEPRSIAEAQPVKPSVAPKPAAAAPARPASSALPSFPPPRSAPEFETAYRTLRASPAQLGAYLLSVEPSQYPALVRTLLDDEFLTDFFKAVLDGMLPQNPASAAAALQALTHVARFDTVCMFLDADSAKRVNEIFAALKRNLEAARLTEATYAGLRKRYPE